MRLLTLLAGLMASQLSFANICFSDFPPESLQDDNLTSPIEQFCRGLYHEKGIGFAHSQSESFQWYLKAASQGLVSAEFNVANGYYNGTGVRKDLVRAKQWYTRSARQESKEAMHMLGIMAQSGQAGPVDYGEAVLWYQRASNRGHPTAMQNLASLYYHGRGTTRNPCMAMKWMILAERHGNPDAGRLADQLASSLPSSVFFCGLNRADNWRPSSR